ncbi:MAG: thiamine phosphate synthase [Chloroflexales bacterium]|nr:thiamine phosphate synthase [Chloroflexales bacterium]
MSAQIDVHMKLPQPPLLLITDRTLARRPLFEVVTMALAGGCRWIMVREKDLSPPKLTSLVKMIITATQPYAATVSVNGNLAVAAACRINAIHLPQGQSVAAARQQLGADGWIGVSAHSLAEAQCAATDGADYVTLSPIFPTQSKPGYGPALGLDELRRVAATLPIPVVALGGITPDSIAPCYSAGAAGAAVMGAVMQAANPQVVLRRLIERWAEVGNREAASSQSSMSF